MQSMFLKKLNREDLEEVQPQNAFQEIANNPLKALNLDRNSDAYKQIMSQPLSYKSIQERIDSRKY